MEEKKQHQKKHRKNPPQIGGELKPSEIQAHERLAHEDRDPTYPIDPIIGTEKKKKP